MAPSPGRLVNGDDRPEGRPTGVGAQPEGTPTPGFHRLASTFRLLEGEELSALADDIRAHGLIEDIWLYEGEILDGRNRYRACQSADVSPRFATYEGDDPIGFSWSLNGARRQLSAGELAMAALDIEKKYAEEGRRLMSEAAAEEQRRRAERKEQGVADPPHPAEKPKERSPLSRDKAAAVTGSTGRRIAQAKRIEEQAPDLAEKVAAGDLALDRADRIVRDREAQARRVAEAKAAAEADPEPLTVDIRHGSFTDVLADLSDVDAIITDPPYPAEFLPLLDDLAAWADKVLSPEGVLAVLMGQTHLPDVYRRLDGHRPYRWTGCYLTEGPGYVSHPRRVQSSWKPLLVYGGGPRFGDVIRSSGDDKSHHKWGQNYDAFHTIIDRLTTKGQTVADPFMGAGTTLLAAHALGRHGVGADTDPTAVATAKERLL